MKKNLRLLAALAKIIDLEMFWNIDFTNNVKLMTKYEDERILAILKAKFKFDRFTESGYIRFTRKDLVIYVTQKNKFDF